MGKLHASARSGHPRPRVLYSTWATSLAATAIFIFSPEHSDANVFCKALEIAGAGSQGAVVPPLNKHQNEVPASPSFAGLRRGLGEEELAARLHVDSQHVSTEQKAEKEEKEEEGDVGAEPEQIHLSLARSGVEIYGMTVAWATWLETPDPRVVWGTSPNEMNNAAEGSTTTYSANHPGRAPYTSGFLHSATMVNLLPSTTYYYSCGDEALGMSSVRSFVTPPMVGGEQAVTFSVVGDLGQTEDSERTLAAIGADSSLDLVLHAGDLSYADCDQPRWDSFMRMLDPVASRLPWMVAAGNHEIEAGSTGGKPFVAYEKRFRMPAVAAPKQSFACGRGGGLDGDVSRGLCWEGLGEDEAQAAARQEAMRLGHPSQLAVEVEVEERRQSSGVSSRDVDLAVAAAARHVREQFDPHVDEGVSGEGSRGGDETVGRGGKGKVGEEASAPVESSGGGGGGVSCCPSEWSGTYDYGNSFYSFNVASVHVVVLNPYAATGENSLQHEWLQEDLESTDRDLTPWVITMFHCPWYNSNLAHQGERQQETAMRTLEPLLNKHKVAIIISGHVHAYERSHPVVDHELSVDAPMYLVVGGAGNREGHAADFYPKPDWSAFRDGSAYGSGRLSIRNSALALWEWTSTDEGSGVHDVAWINNPYPNAEPRRASITGAAPGEPPFPGILDADDGPNRHGIASVHVSSKMQKGNEEQEVVLGAGADDEEEELREDGTDRHDAHGRMGKLLRIPGLSDRRHRMA